MLVASLLLLFITWLVLGTHLYSPFCRGDTLIYMDLCEPKSFEFLKIWRYVDIYEDTWQVETPTIPNFICTHSPSIFLDFQGVSAFGVLAVTPFLHHFRIWLYWILSDYTILLKLLDGIIQRFGSHMNIPIHCCFDAGMTQQLLQHLRLRPAFNRSCSIGMSQGVHTEFFNSCFVAELVKVDINCIPSALAKKDTLLQINYSI